MRCGWSYKGDLAERRKDEMKATCIGKLQGRCLKANGGMEEKREGLSQTGLVLHYLPCLFLFVLRQRVLAEHVTESYLESPGKIPRLKNSLEYLSK